MANCGFEWSMCATCANSGSSLCPIEHTRTIKELKEEIEELEDRVNQIDQKTK